MDSSNQAPNQPPNENFSQKNNDQLSNEPSSAEVKSERQPKSRRGRKTIIWILVALVVVALGAYLIHRHYSATKPTIQGLSTNKPWGIWTIHQTAFGGNNKQIPDWYKGNLVTVYWSDIEPTPGNFVFNSKDPKSSLDQKLDAVTDRGLNAMAMVYTGESVPAWLADPKDPHYVGPGAGLQLDGRNYPLYLNPVTKDPNPVYLTYFHRMINALSDHMNHYAHNRDKIIGLQCPVAESGDPHPYNPNGPAFRPGSNGFGLEGTSSFIPTRPVDKWAQFQEGEFVFYVNAVKKNNPATPCLINANYNRDTANFALQKLSGEWLKLSRIGDRYNNNNEYNWADPTNQGDDAFYVSTFTREYYNGQAIRTRSEMDLTGKNDKPRSGWFKEAPVWQMYWSQLWALDRGMDMHNQTIEDAQNPDFASAFEFFNQHAGYKSPQESPSAWIAFRDNLDAADTTRFPESQYGAYNNGKNSARYQAIEKDFFRYGVQKPTDGDYARTDLGATDWNALEDVGNNNYPGNYSHWMTMKDPNGTSQGLWRVGTMKEPYGRFARRFDHATGKDKFYLNIDDRFFDSGGLKGTYPVEVRVVYYDSGNGKFSVKYDDVGHTGKTAVTVTKTNTNTWKEVKVTIRDGSFSNHLEQGSDIILQTEDSENDIFHMVEITRLNQ